MTSVNKVIIVGRLGHDPEVRQFQNGGGVTNISVATSEKWTDKNTGEKREQTEWHRIALFGRLGETAAQYLRKGSLVYIEGNLRTNKWQDQNGQERSSVEIRANQMTMLDSRQNTDGYNYNDPRQFNNQPQQGMGGYPNQNYGQNHNPSYEATGFQQNSSWGNPNNGMNQQSQYPQNQGGFGSAPASAVPQAQGFTTPNVPPQGSNNAPNGANMSNGNAFMQPPTPAPAPKAITPPSKVSDDDIPF